MKRSSRRVLNVLAAVFLATLLAACGQDSSSSDENARTTSEQSGSDPSTGAQMNDNPAIVFLGDSLTAGLGLAERESAPALIQEKITQANLNYTVINAGRSGDTTAGGLARLAWYLRPEVRPKILVIGLGSNDAMRGLPLAEISKNLSEIIRRAREFDPEIQIFLYQMHTFPNMGPRYTRDYEALFGKVARTEKITLLPFPLLGVAGKAELNQPDGIHPTAKGARIMADNIWKGLAPHLRAAQI